MKYLGTKNSTKSISTMGDMADSKKEAFQEWGGRSIANGLSPIDSACIGEFGANRLLGFPAERMVYQAASTTGFIEKPKTKSDVANLFGGTSAPFAIGDADKPRPLMKMRLFLNFSNGSTEHSCLYCAAKKLLVCINSCGMTNLRVKVLGLTIDKIDTGHSNIESYEELADVPVDGWSGWNSIPIDVLIGAYAGQGGDHYGRLCIEMYSTEGGTKQYSGRVGICGMRLIAPTMYYSSYSLAKDNLPYELDPNGYPVFNRIILRNGSLFASIYVNGDGRLVADDSAGQRLL